MSILPTGRGGPSSAVRSSLVLVVLGLSIGGCPRPPQFRDAFDVNKANLVPDGANDYFSLEPGTIRRYAGGAVDLTITVLDETMVVDEVTTRIIEEREEEGGQLIEVSRNFFARDTATNDVYYFGEDVDIYADGQIVSHDGAWRSGVDGARFGLIMPAQAVVGDRYYQEIAPGVAEDRAEVLATDEDFDAPVGMFENVVHVVETSPLEPGHESHKWYAAGVGLIADGDVELVDIVDP